MKNIWTCPQETKNFEMDLERERCDENASINSNLIKFRGLLKLDEIKGLTVNSIRSTNVIYLSSNTECTQFDINITLALNFNVDMKITYPRVALFTNEILDVSKLRININNNRLKQEIISCINYLQRQRNVNLALHVLKKCALLMAERKMVLDMLMLQSENCIKSVAHEDSGFLIQCEDEMTHFKFFESLWKIHFDCQSHDVSDYIDFSITTIDPVFHNSAKAAMNTLVQSDIPYNNKVQLWWTIVQAFNLSLEREIIIHDDQWGSRHFLRVRSIQEINAICAEQYEIIESDDEDCIVIED